MSNTKNPEEGYSGPMGISKTHVVTPAPSKFPHKRISPLKGVVPEPIKPAKIDLYVFSVGEEDLRNWTLENIILGKSHNFIGVATPDEFDKKIKGKALRHIHYRFTQRFKKMLESSSATNITREVLKELDIINFEGNDHLTLENLPKVLVELMNEDKPGSIYLVGDVVQLQRDYVSINLKKGDCGIVYDVMTPSMTKFEMGGIQVTTTTNSPFDENQGDNISISVIFANGEYCSWDCLEKQTAFTLLHRSTNQRILNYKFKNVNQLCKDFEDGEFDSEFYDLH